MRLGVLCLFGFGVLLHCGKTKPDAPAKSDAVKISLTSSPEHQAYVSSLADVTLTFSAATQGADNAANYLLTGTGVGSLNLASVAALGSNKYSLKFSGSAVTGSVILRLQNISGASGEALSQDSLFYNIDTTNPLVSFSLVQNSTVNTLASLTLTYSKTVSGANLAANYSLSGPGVGSLAVSGVSVLSAKVFRVNFSGSLSSGGFSLMLNNISDPEGRALVGGSANYIADIAAATMSAVPASGSSIPQPAQVEITFSEQPLNALATSAYVLSGAGKGTLAVASVTQLTTYKFRLNLSGSGIGGAFVVNPDGVTDLAGNAIAGSLSYTIDLTAPTKVPNPVSGSTVTNLTQVDITFSEVVLNAGIAANYLVTGAGAGSLAPQSITPLGGNVYRLLLSGTSATGAINFQILNVTDAVGNNLVVPTFAYTADATPANISSTFPTAGGQGAVGTNIQVVFAENISCASVTGATFFIQGGVPATIGCVANTITLDPASNLLPGTAYTVTVGAITDLLGNPRSAPYNFTFTTYATAQPGTSGNDTFWGVATSVTGDIYVSGFTDSALDGQTNAGQTDVVLMKFNAAGQKQWTRLWGTAFDDEGPQIVTDSVGNIYVAGFKNVPRNAFLNKYNSSGNLVWTRDIAGLEANGMGIDQYDYLYIAGITNSSGQGIYITKFDPLGQQQWIKYDAMSSGYHYGRRLAVQSDGTSFYAGYGSPTGFGAPQGFIRKYDSYGNFVTSTYLSGANTILFNDIAVAPDLTIAAVGWTSVALPGNSLIGGHDMFVARYTNSLGSIWIQQIGTTSGDEGRSLAIDSAGDIYFAGETSASFYGNPWVNSYDIGLGKISSAGTLLWTRQLGSFGWDDPLKMTIDLNGWLNITGYTSGSLDGLNYAGNNDAFLVRYDTLGNRK